MDLTLLTSPSTNKPWLNIFANSVTANSVTASGVQNFTGDVDMKQDLRVAGYFNSAGLSPGAILISSGTQTIAIPAGTGGENITYNPLLDKVTISGLTGTNTAFETINGATYAQLTTPFSNPFIEYSPQLNIYACIDGNGTAVYTSVNASSGAGNYTLRPSVTTPFNSFFLKWIPFFGRFYTSSSDTARQVYSSTDGITWATQASTRLPYNFAFSAKLATLVAVGDGGTQYTKDGVTWLPGSTAAKMSDVVWCDLYDCFVAIPRAAPLGIIWRSVDGINWTSTVTGFTTNIRSLVWSDDLTLFIAAGDSDVMWISQDGFNWKRVQLVTSALASYGAIYIPRWGMYISSGIGLFVRVSPKLFT